MNKSWSHFSSNKPPPLEPDQLSSSFIEPQIASFARACPCHRLHALLLPSQHHKFDRSIIKAEPSEPYRMCCHSTTWSTIHGSNTHHHYHCYLPNPFYVMWTLWSFPRSPDDQCCTSPRFRYGICLVLVISRANGLLRYGSFCSSIMCWLVWLPDYWFSVGTWYLLSWSISSSCIAMRSVNGIETLVLKRCLQFL